MTTYKQFREFIDEFEANLAERGQDPSDFVVVFREKEFKIVLMQNYIREYMHEHMKEN